MRLTLLFILFPFVVSAQTTQIIGAKNTLVKFPGKVQFDSLGNVTNGVQSTLVLPAGIIMSGGSQTAQYTRAYSTYTNGTATVTVQQNPSAVSSNTVIYPLSSGHMFTDADSGVLYTTPTQTGTLVQALTSPSTNTYASTLALNVLINTNVQTVSSAANLSMITGGFFIFTGSTTTWTLPNTSLYSGNRTFFIKNRGSGAITLNTNGGGNVIYTSTTVNTISLAAGESALLFFDGTYFCRLF